MPAVFLSSWTVLRFLHFPEPAAFVWAGVLAQAAQLCSVLPVTVWRLRKAFGRARTGARWSVAFYFCVFAFQVWLSDPVISQRLVSIICGIYVMVMALGVKGDPAILNYFAPAANEMDVPLNFRRHLLKLYALMAMLVVASNETLLALDAPLGVTVVTLSLLPLVLHYFFVITLCLTCPPLEERDT